MNSNIKLLISLSFFKQLMFAMPVIVILLQNRAGLSFGDYIITESIYALTILLFEMPAGRLSDLWNRK